MNYKNLNKPYQIIYPRHVVLVVSHSILDNKPNAMAVAWSSFVSMKPPIFSICIAPKRYTWELIEKSGQFTINVPTMDIVKEVLYFGRVSGRDEDKFDNVNLTLSKGQIVNTPIINECVGFFECKLIKKIKIGDHFVVFGQVLKSYAKNESLNENWYDLNKNNFIYHCGGNRFTTNSGKISEISEWWK
ncbi:MAG: flavin reductase family protein [Candidatus Helarchaeota archaeon]